MHKGLLLPALIFVLPVWAATDVTGVWSGTIGGPIYLTLKQEGNKLSGTAGTGPISVIGRFAGGQVDGDRIVFHVGPFDLDLRLDGDQLTGEATGDHEGPVRVFLKRVGGGGKRAASVFDAASVKRVAHDFSNGVSTSMKMDPGRIALTSITLKRVLERAYDLRDYQIAGPDWLDTDLYEMVATMPPDTTREDLQVMLRSLLADRFKLALHRETKELPVYELVVGDPTRLHRVGSGSGTTNRSSGRIVAKAVTLQNFVDTLSHLMDRPVLDASDLKGVFDFTLEWTPDASAANVDSAGGPSLFTAVQEQLGLRLAAKKTPTEILIVDRAERIPTGNQR